MASTVRIPRLTYALIAVAAAVIILMAMKEANTILSPLLLAMVLAIIVSPLVNRLINRGMAGWLALTITLLIFIGVILLLVGLVTLSLRGFADSLPRYQQQLTDIRAELDDTLSGFGLDLENVLSEAGISPQTLLGTAGSFIRGLVSGLANWGIVLLAGAFFLTEARILPRLLRNLAGEEQPIVVRIARFGRDVRRFMLITTYIGLLTAAVNLPLLLIVGVDFALLWAVLSFFLNYVPNIGFLLSVIPPGLLALMEFGVGPAVIVVVGFILINAFFENVVKPRIYEEDFDLAPSVTFVSLVVWTWVLGALGAILAIPMTMFVQLLLESSEETRWLAYLFGTGKEPFEPEVETPAEVIAGRELPEDVGGAPPA